MLELIHGIPARLEKLRAMLKAREGRKEFSENVPLIRAEIARLEAATLTKEAAVASRDQSGSRADREDIP